MRIVLLLVNPAIKVEIPYLVLPLTLELLPEVAEAVQDI